MQSKSDEHKRSSLMCNNQDCKHFFSCLCIRTFIRSSLEEIFMNALSVKGFQFSTYTFLISSFSVVLNFLISIYTYILLQWEKISFMRKGKRKVLSLPLCFFMLHSHPFHIKIHSAIKSLFFLSLYFCYTLIIYGAHDDILK